jgi:predicted metal-dependent hydrolase
MEEVPAEFWQGVEQFNQGEFYACHDTLEAIWIEAPPSEKNFYQGILQIAVALYHLGNQNWRGAVILLGEGANRLCKYPAEYAGIDVGDLVDRSVELLSALQAVGSDRIQDVVLMPSISEAKRESEKVFLRQPTIQKLAPSLVE